VEHNIATAMALRSPAKRPLDLEALLSAPELVMLFENADHAPATTELLLVSFIKYGAAAITPTPLSVAFVQFPRFPYEYNMKGIHPKVLFMPGSTFRNMSLIPALLTVVLRVMNGGAVWFPPGP